MDESDRFAGLFSGNLDKLPPEKKARAIIDYTEFEHYRHYLDTR